MGRETAPDVMADAVVFSVAAVHEEFEVAGGERLSCLCLRTKDVRQARNQGFRVDQVLGKAGELVVVLFEVGQVDADLDPRGRAQWPGHPIPEVLSAELAKGIRKRWVEDEPQSMQQVAL